jgi:hypothetical protein
VIITTAAMVRDSVPIYMKNPRNIKTMPRDSDEIASPDLFMNSQTRTASSSRGTSQEALRYPCLSFSLHRTSAQSSAAEIIAEIKKQDEKTMMDSQ